MSEPQAVELLADDFTSYPLCERMESPATVGQEWAQTPLGAEGFGPWTQRTLHYMWRSARVGDWIRCRLPWRIIERDGRRFLDQPESFPNVVLTAGQADWRDYTMELEVAVADGPAGPVVRYKTSRQNYWVCLQAGKPLHLIRRDQEEHVVLAAGGPVIESDRLYRCRVRCEGELLEVCLDGHVVLSAYDDAYSCGGVGLRTDGPGRFAAVRVTAVPEEAQRIQAASHARQARLRGRRSGFPRPRIIHTIRVSPDANWVQLQDVNGDGRPEVLAFSLSVPELDYIRVTGLTALDWNGRELWRFGERVESRHAVHGGFAFNAADIDADGRTEILLTRDFEILLIDGATGQVKRRCPTPLAYKGHEDHYPRTVGDSFLVCNLRGLPTAQDFILKDRYCNLWAYTGRLEPLWHRHLNTGHYPRAADLNGDGRDEVMAGYSLLDGDGNTLWTVPGGDPLRNRYPGPEHMDSVLLDRFGPEEQGPPRIAMAASDLGFLLLDAEGRILAQHRVGHAQSLGAARFRPDLAGRQFVVVTAWGNFGIVNLFDSSGRLLLIREMPDPSAMPVNWLGDGSALLHFGDCLAEGNFDAVVELPKGSPVYPIAWDVNGDGVDELLLRRGDTIDILGPDRLPAKPVHTAVRTLTNWNIYGGFSI